MSENNVSVDVLFGEEDGFSTAVPSEETVMLPVQDNARRMMEITAPRIAHDSHNNGEGFVVSPRRLPNGGFRGFMYRISGGRINLGPSSVQMKNEERAERIARPLLRPYSTAFVSFKGGIGKTSSVVGVGLVLGELRGAPACAIDTNPDSGDLAERLVGPSDFHAHEVATVTDLVANIDHVDSLTALSRYVTQHGRYHCVPGEQDPTVSQSMTSDQFARVYELLTQYYPLILTDCGTGVTHDATRGILDKADNIVINAGYAVSGAKRAAGTLDWLAEHGYPHLAENAIVVLTDKDGVSTRVQKDVIRRHLAEQCRGVYVVPRDPVLADGDRISLDRLNHETREAYADIAAAIVDGYL